MLVIESNSVNSGTEVLIENVCIKWHVLQTYCFPSNGDCTLKKFCYKYLLLQKCELISYKVIDYKHNTDPICLFSFLLVTKCFFLRGSISQYSNELYLCFLAIFFLSLLSVLLEHNIKCISYCSLWQFNLLCVILQISSTNDCMPLILLTSLISPNFHHIPQEKINPLLYFFAELHNLYGMFQSTTKILSLHDNVLRCTSSTQICSQPQHRTPPFAAQTVRFISAPLILSLLGRSTGITCLFTRHRSHCTVYSHY